MGARDVTDPEPGEVRPFKASFQLRLLAALSSERPHGRSNPETPEDEGAQAPEADAPAD